MKTTFEELQQLFRLKDPDYRQIKAGLVNKIRMVNEQNVLVEDEVLKEILAEFRIGGSMDLDEASKEFNIDKNTLHQMARARAVSSFQLVTSKGSKLLFLRKELEKENNVLLTRTKAIDWNKFAGISSKILQDLVNERFISQRDFAMFMDYYFEHLTLEEIGEKHTITRDRTREVLQKNNRRLVHLFCSTYQYKKRNEEMSKDYSVMKTKYDEQKKILEGLKDLEKYFINKPKPVGKGPGYDSTKIMDLDLSVRTINCLRSLDIETIGDLKNTDKSLLLGSRNFGKKSIKEIEELLLFYS